MHTDLVNFVMQIRELEERASVRGLFSTYQWWGNQQRAKCVDTHDDDLTVLKGLSYQRQSFLLRKQFDHRFRKLAQISLMQRVRIERYRAFIERGEVVVAEAARRGLDSG